ncbi:MAG: hypothetical protein KJ747_09050 [Actinobacteria bacterium]|nr:hypothetical protein [Actinomycetota bacterium]
MRKFQLCILLIALMAASSLWTPSTAIATPPQATSAHFTNPVAYELKSLLTTEFKCTIDKPGTWAVLDIFSADGIVKNVYDGPISVAGEEVTFPAWDGTDYRRRRMPSASYEWRLTLLKNGERSYTRGKICVSKINFFISGVSDNGEGVQVFSRYMIPGNANIYMRLRDPYAASDPGRFLSSLIGWIEYPPPHREQRIEIGSWRLPEAETLDVTHYLRDADSIRYRGMHGFTFSDYHTVFYMTVIQ